jgi:ribosomal protein S18 acetylase RimI-like enzyme
VNRVAALWGDLLAYHREIGERDIRPTKAATEARQFIKEHVGTKDRLCLVAESNGGAVGFLVATLRKRSPAFGGWAYGHIYDVYVDGPHRRAGLGTALVEEALRWFRGSGVRRVQLQVRARNTGGTRFWKELGFDVLAMTLERRL